MFTLSQQGGLNKEDTFSAVYFVDFKLNNFQFYISSIHKLNHWNEPQQKIESLWATLFLVLHKATSGKIFFFYSMAQFSIIFYNDTTKKVLLGDYSWAVCTTRFRQKKVANEKSSIKEKQGRNYSRAIFNHDYSLKLSGYI